MKLSDKIAEYRLARDLFPLCYICGRDLRADRLFSLRLCGERPNRFACDVCPSHTPEAAD